MEEYFELNPKSGAFNQSNRGYPDVSLMAFNFQSVTGGRSSFVYGGIGINAFAAMVSLVNAARVSRGKGPIGFLNGILYSFYSLFAHDITEGDNSCAAGYSPNCCAGLGFQAAEGWDPVTGLGSINFEAFLKFLENLGEAEGVGGQGGGQSGGDGQYGIEDEQMRRSLRAR